MKSQYIDIRVWIPSEDGDDGPVDPQLAMEDALRYSNCYSRAELLTKTIEYGELPEGKEPTDET